MKTNVIKANIIGDRREAGGEPVPEPDITDGLLLEDGSLFLMEDGSYFQLESAVEAAKINKSYWNF